MMLTAIGPVLAIALVLPLTAAADESQSRSSDVTRTKVVGVDELELDSEVGAGTKRSGRKRGYGLDLQYGMLGPVGGKISGLAEDLGFSGENFYLFTGNHTTAWFAISRHLRVGGFIWDVGSQAEEAFSQDRIERLDLELTGGGALVELTWALSNAFAWSGLELGLGQLEATVARAELGSPGSYDEFTTELRTALALDTWQRSLVASGPLASIGGGAEYLVADWFAVGARAGWRLLFLPSGTWVDSGSGGQVGDAPSMAAHGWDLGLYITLGVFPGTL